MFSTSREESKSLTFCVMPGGDAAPFSEPLPNLHRVGGGLFLFQQQVHLVDVVTVD